MLSSQGSFRRVKIVLTIARYKSHGVPCPEHCPACGIADTCASVVSVPLRHVQQVKCNDAHCSISKNPLVQPAEIPFLNLLPTV